MKETKLLVVEDDISFATEVEIELEKSRFKEIRKAYDTKSACNLIIEYHPDLAIIDLRLDGDPEELVVAKTLSKYNVPFIVMTQFADEQLYDHVTEYNPLAYFTKPLNYVALKYMIQSYIKSASSVGQKSEILSDKANEFVYIKKGSKYIQLRFDNLYFIQADGNYITLNSQASKYIVRSSLKNCINLLPSGQFLQVHRNFVVNRKYVLEYNTDDKTILVNNKAIPVGRSYKGNLKKQLKIL